MTFSSEFEIWRKKCFAWNTIEFHNYYNGARGLSATVTLTLLPPLTCWPNPNNGDLVIRTAMHCMLYATEDDLWTVHIGVNWPIHVRWGSCVWITLVVLWYWKIRTPFNWSWGLLCNLFCYSLIFVVKTIDRKKWSTENKEVLRLATL